jgi:hypothetical protein
LNTAASSKLSDYPTHGREDEGLKQIEMIKKLRRLLLERNVIPMLGANNEKILPSSGRIGRGQRGAKNGEGRAVLS